MATVEYIGARYVPVFFKNPGTGSTEWIDSVTYEPLTIVTYNGYSYTSRRFVPVGIAITNNDYWALTGNFNGQVAVYVERVNELAEQVAEISGDMITADEVAQQITAALTSYATKQYVDDAVAQSSGGLPDDPRYLPGLKGKYVVAIGDSLIRGDSLPYSAAWPAVITNAYGGSSAGTLISNKGFNGMSLASRSGDNNDFFDRWASIQSDIDTTLRSRGETLPYAIVVQGGANDFNANIEIGSRSMSNVTTTTFWGAMNQIAKLIRTAYPQVKLMYMTTPLRKTSQNTLGLSELDYVRAMLDFCRAAAIPCMDTQSALGIDIINTQNDFDWALESADLPGESTGSTHYSAAAYNYMAPTIANWIITGASNTQNANYVDTRVTTGWRAVRFQGGYNFKYGRITYGALNCPNETSSGSGIYYSDIVTLTIPTDLIDFSNTPVFIVQPLASNEGFEQWCSIIGTPSQADQTIKVRVFSRQSGNRSTYFNIIAFGNT